VSGILTSGDYPQGTITQPQLIAGSYTYTLTCGSGAAQASATATINWSQQAVPTVTLAPRGSGEFIAQGAGGLIWTTNVLPCFGGGGTASDNFTGQELGYQGNGQGYASAAEPTAGSYTLSITCGVGTTATATATVVFNNAGGSVLTLSPAFESQVVAGQPTYIAWQSAVGPCVGYDGAGSDGWNGAHPQNGTFSLIEPEGYYVVTLVCGQGAQAVEAQVQDYVGAYNGVAANLDEVSSYANPNTAIIGHPVTLNYGGFGAVSCTASGGISGDGWGGTLPWTGLIPVSESQLGNVTYNLTCQHGSDSAQTSLTIMWQPNPAVTLTASTQQAVLGQPFTLTWQTTNTYYACGASSDDPTSAWAGIILGNGSESITAASGTTHTYTLTCDTELGNVIANATVKFSASSSSGSGSDSSSGSGSGSGSGSSASSGGSHGGGAIDPFLLAFLSVLSVMQARSAGRSRRSEFP
jgi:hypothetical protein